METHKIAISGHYKQSNIGNYIWLHFIYIHSGRKLEHTVNNRIKQSPQEPSGNYRAGRPTLTTETGRWSPTAPLGLCRGPGGLSVPNTYG